MVKPMDVEVLIHGVPYGEDYYGVDDERRYCLGFYDGDKSDLVKFLIQVRKIADKTYCYYHYLVKKDVSANDSRQGSYFGMTIRMDAYCVNFKTIFEVLDLVFNGYVVGNVLKKTEIGGYKYLVSSFKDKEIGKELYDKVLNLLGMFLKKEEIASLNGLTVKSGNYPSENLNEVDEKWVKTALVQYGSIALSPYYASHQTQKLLAEKDAACKKQLSDKDIQIVDTERRLSEAKAETSEKVAAESRKWDEKMRSQKSEFETKISRLQDDLQKSKSETNSKIEDATRKMRDEMQSQKNDYESKIRRVNDELSRVKSESNGRVEETEQKWRNKLKSQEVEYESKLNRLKENAGKSADKDQIEELQTKIEKLQSEIRRKDAELCDSSKELDEKTERLLKMINDKEMVDSESSSEGKKIHSLSQDEFEEIVDEVKSLRRRVSELKNLTESLKQQIEIVCSDLKSLNRDFKSQKINEESTKNSQSQFSQSVKHKGKQKSKDIEDDEEEAEELEKETEKRGTKSDFLKKIPWKMALLIGGVVLALVLLGVLLFAVL